MNSPLISIITINLNNADGLRKTIESVLNQSFRDYEHLIIDGDSRDLSLSVIKEYESKLAYWKSERDAGVYDAMNKGILNSKGKYLLFLNSGDFLAEENVLSNVSLLLNNEFDIVYGNLKLKDHTTLTDGFMPDIIDLKQMMNDTLWHPVSFIKKELFDQYGLYNTSYKIVGDYDFFFNVIISKKARTKHVNLFIAVFDLSGMSSSPSNVSLIKAERERVQLSYLGHDGIENFKKENPVEDVQKKKGFFKKWFR